mmetsp:Transcript_93649/g.269626  ORF Transcript_93649/g.269626 Transcript_93649/m.269626 type:complete len:475 (+) Transcript_93649:1162-2586(+)
MRRSVVTYLKVPGHHRPGRVQVRHAGFPALAGQGLGVLARGLVVVVVGECRADAHGLDGEAGRPGACALLPPCLLGRRLVVHHPPRGLHQVLRTGPDRTGLFQAVDDAPPLHRGQGRGDDFGDVQRAEAHGGGHLRVGVAPRGLRHPHRPLRAFRHGVRAGAALAHAGRQGRGGVPVVAGAHLPHFDPRHQRGFDHRHEGHKYQLGKAPQEGGGLRPPRATVVVDVERPGGHAVDLPAHVGHRGRQPRSRPCDHTGPSHDPRGSRPILLWYGHHVRTAPRHHQAPLRRRACAAARAPRWPRVAFARRRRWPPPRELLRAAPHRQQRRQVLEGDAVVHRKRRPETRVPPGRRPRHGHRLVPGSLQHILVRQGMVLVHPHGLRPLPVDPHPYRQPRRGQRQCDLRLPVLHLLPQHGPVAVSSHQVFDGRPPQQILRQVRVREGARICFQQLAGCGQPLAYDPSRRHALHRTLDPMS